MSILLDLYEEYVKERQGGEVFFDSEFFVSYKISGEELFIADLFIKKSARGSGKLSDVIKYLESVAKKRECKVLTGNIHTWDPGAGHTLAAAHKIGFRIQAANNGAILIIKEVG